MKRNPKTKQSHAQKTPKNKPNQNTIVRVEHIYLAVFEGILLQPLRLSVREMIFSDPFQLSLQNRRG